MAIKLRENEAVQIEANFHWSAFIFSKILACFGGLIFLFTIVAAMGDTEGKSSEITYTGCMLTAMLIAPFVYKWLQNKFKCYVVTNQRVYIEKGILAKSKNDLPLQKINDVSLKQGILQRLFGAGDIVIFTGNDKFTILKDLDHPEDFKSAVSEMIEKRMAS